MVVKLCMQYCGKNFKDSFETYKMFLRSIINEFKSKVDVQHHEFGWVSFQNTFLELLKNDDEK